MSAVAVFWRAVLTQGVFFGTFIGAYAYSRDGRVGGAVSTALFGMVFMGAFQGVMAIRERRRWSQQLGGLFERRTPAELRHGLQRPDRADPALAADLHGLLRLQLGTYGRVPAAAPLVAGVLVVGTSVAGFVISPAWFLAALAGAALFGEAFLRRGRLRMALQRLEQLDGRPV